MLIDRRNKELEKKERMKDTSIEESKYWNSQYYLYLNELNQVKKSEQEINFLKGKESLLKTKEKVLDKQRKSIFMTKQFEEDQKQIDKVRIDIEMEIMAQKERIKLDSVGYTREKERTSTKSKNFDLNFLITEPGSYLNNY